MQNILTKCETLQHSTKPTETHDLSFETEIENWPLDKNTADINLDGKTPPHSNWSEFGDINNDDSQSHQSKEENSVKSERPCCALLIRVLRTLHFCLITKDMDFYELIFFSGSYTVVQCSQTRPSISDIT